MWGTSPRQRLRLAPLCTAIALGNLAPRRPRVRALRLAPFAPGLSIVIPDRDAPDLLLAALDSVRAAAGSVSDPLQVIVVANGAPAARYRAVALRHPDVEWIHHPEPCGFSAAIARGLAAVRHDWTLLLNNDMTLDIGALDALARERAADVFAIAAQIEQRSADGRREETGFTDWYIDATGPRVYHAPVNGHERPRSHACASGGGALFRTQVLRRYVDDGRIYDPFYWEDVEWSVRAQRAGLRVLFCPAARVHHRHRATASRFYSASEIDRIVERNRIAFDARNALTENGAAWLMARVCELDYRSQRDLARPVTALAVLRARWAARRAPLPASPPAIGSPDRAVVSLTSSFSFTLRKRAGRRRVLVVAPFCVFPARHGGARRIEGLLRVLRNEFDIALVGDEAPLYGATSFAHFDGLCGVTLVHRTGADTAFGGDLNARMRAHAHSALREAVASAIDQHRPDIVQIEHAELALLSRPGRGRARWVLGLHDAWRSDDFDDRREGEGLEAHIRNSYDAVTVASAEDHALVAHPRCVCVPNATGIALGACPPSHGARLLFSGPFRYTPNLDGIRAFLTSAWPAIRAAVPGATLVVLGGDEGCRIAALDERFRQPGVEVRGHSDDILSFLASAALSINPLSGIRGSSVKVVESLVAGRACVSTEEGARGFSDAGMSGLVLVRDVAEMAEPIIALLRDEPRRHAIEAPAAALARFTWPHAAHVLSRLYHDLLGDSGA